MTSRNRDDEPAPDGAKKWLAAVGALVVIGVLSLGCGCGGVMLWMMMGSPWPIDLSAFAE